MIAAFAAETLRNKGEDLVRVPGRTFTMGSDDQYPEEAPAHPVNVDGLWIERTPFTNGSSRRSSTQLAT